MARNPFRSEAEAFRLVLMTVVAFAAIAVASVLGGAWVGVPVWAMLTVAAAAFFLAQRRAARGIPTAPPHVGGEDERRILVILAGAAADETIVGAIEEASNGYQKRVLVVCPTRVSSIGHWTSAVDGARAQAQRYLDESRTHLQDAGIESLGDIGDEDPLRAIEDALRTFGADAILVVTPAEGFDDAAARDVVAGARARFALPITRVSVTASAQATAAVD